MTKDEALKMAIDGLEIHQQDILNACKEALEQPTTQEPVAWMSEEVLPLNHIIKAVVRREPDEQYTIPLYTHPVVLDNRTTQDLAFGQHWKRTHD